MCQKLKLNGLDSRRLFLPVEQWLPGPGHLAILEQMNRATHSPNALREKDIPRLEAVQSSLCSKTGAYPCLFVLIWVQDPYQMQSIQSDHVYKWSLSILNDGTLRQTMSLNAQNICLVNEGLRPIINSHSYLLNNSPIHP